MKEQVLILMSVIKASLIKVLLIIAAFLLPIKPLILIVGVCIAIDTLFGIWRSKNKKEKITSRKLSAIISKMVLYQSAIILFFAIDVFLLGDIIGIFTDIPLLLTKLVAIFFVYIELKSMNESFVSVKGYSIWSKVKEMLKRAKSIKSEFEDFKKEKKEE